SPHIHPSAKSPHTSQGTASDPLDLVLNESRIPPLPPDDRIAKGRPDDCVPVHHAFALPPAFHRLAGNFLPTTPSSWPPPPAPASAPPASPSHPSSPGSTPNRFLAPASCSAGTAEDGCCT